MKKILIISLMLCLAIFSLAEENVYYHGFTLDLGGPATRIQLEYQSDLISNGKHHFGPSIGIGKSTNADALPFGLQYRFGNTFQIETGIHYTFLFSENEFNSIVSLRLGLRLNVKRFFIHAYVAPIMNGLLPSQLWGGLGLGVNL